MKKTGAVLAVGFLLAGCSAQAQDPPEPTETTVEAAEDSAIIYCRAMNETLQEYTDAVSGVTQVPAEIDPFDWLALSSKLGELDPSGLGEEWAQDHADYLTMRTQIDAALENGAGPVTFDTSAWKAGSLALLQHCVGAGYKAGD